MLLYELSPAQNCKTKHKIILAHSIIGWTMENRLGTRTVCTRGNDLWNECNLHTNTPHANHWYHAHRNNHPHWKNWNCGGLSLLKGPEVGCEHLCAKQIAVQSMSEKHTHTHSSSTKQSWMNTGRSKAKPPVAKIMQLADECAECKHAKTKNACSFVPIWAPYKIWRQHVEYGDMEALPDWSNR